MRLQFDKRHGTTVVATAPVLANRFLGYNGAHASATTGGAADAQGVSETAAATGEAVTVVTRYSYLVEASAAIVRNAFVKPAADGSGRAVAGSMTDHCGRALAAATAAGQLIEVEILKHVHP